MMESKFISLGKMRNEKRKIFWNEKFFDQKIYIERERWRNLCVCVYVVDGYDSIKINDSTIDWL